MSPRTTKASPERGDLPARAAVRAAGLRATPQRVAVFRTLQLADGHHLSADDVWRRLHDHPASMDRSTAYRALADLTSKGLLTEVRLSDGVARFEIQDEAHHHAVCTHCGATSDVSPEAVRALGRLLHRESGFVLGSQPLLLAGLCSRCAARPRGR